MAIVPTAVLHRSQPTAGSLNEFRLRLCEARVLQQPTGLILVVDDNDDVRGLTVSILEGRGYQVLEANRGEMALRVASTAPSPIDVVITDVHMPGMSVVDMIESLNSTHPEAKFLLLSGFVDPTLVFQKSGIKLDQLLKPCSPTLLARKIRELVDP